MGKPLYTNNAFTTLASGISPTDTTIQVASNTGSLFPSPTGSDYFYMTLISVSTGAMEIVKVTERVADVMTVVRGQEGTTAQWFSIGDNSQLRITAAGMNLAVSGGGGGGGTAQQAYQIATAGQTAFTVPFTFTGGGANLYVFVNGLKKVYTLNYQETSSTSILFFSGLTAGDVVEFITP